MRGLVQVTDDVSLEAPDHDNGRLWIYLVLLVPGEISDAGVAVCDHSTVGHGALAVSEEGRIRYFWSGLGQHVSGVYCDNLEDGQLEAQR